MGGPLPPRACLLGGLLLAAALPSPRADECPSFGMSYGSSCYILLQGTLESINDAREFCSANASGADIVSINNEEENTFILNSFHTHWHGPAYIPLGMFYDTDDDAFKWYDESRVNFTNWIEEGNSDLLLDTCATMHTTSGGWKKISCEHLPLTGILCEATTAYGKKFLPNATWTIVTVASTVIVAVSAAFLWFLYQRKVSSTTFMAHSFSSRVPCNDETVLIDEETEYTA